MFDSSRSKELPKEKVADWKRMVRFLTPEAIHFLEQELLRKGLPYCYVVSVTLRFREHVLYIDYQDEKDSARLQIPVEFLEKGKLWARK